MTTRIKALVEPDMLVWARETASLTPEEAATALDVTIDRLLAWEKGDDQPTVNQLRRIAQRYKRPLSVFYLSERPKDFQPLRDFRRLPGIGDRRYSAKLAYEVRAAHERRLVALDVLEVLGEQPPALGLAARHTDDPEQIGRRIRERLGITLAQQGRWGEPDKAFRGWRDAIEQAGVLVFVLSGAHHQVDLEEMRGFAIAEQPLPAIIVNGKDRTAGRIFTLLHELAHVVLGESAIENDIEPGDTIPPECDAEPKPNAGGCSPRTNAPQSCRLELGFPSSVLRARLVHGRSVRRRWCCRRSWAQLVEQLRDAARWPKKPAWELAREPE